MIRSMIVSLALMGLPYWLPFEPALAGENCEGPVMILASTDGDHQQVIVTDSAAKGDGQTFEFTSTDGQTHRAFVRMVGEGAHAGVAVTDSGKPRPWLGVMFEPVPESLASQLDLEQGKGLLVANVAKGSPADASGFQVHDVLLSVGAADITDGAQQAVGLLSGFSPGDEVNLGLIQQGQKRSMTIRLADRPEMNAVEWKFEGRNPTDVTERVRTRGKIMGKDAAGKIFVHDVGDIASLPVHLREMLPGGGNRSTRVMVNKDKSTVLTRVEDDGTRINVQRQGDGPIVVERTDENGNQSTATYADEVQLKNGDLQAYELYSGAGVGHWIFQHGDQGQELDLDLEAIVRTDGDSQTHTETETEIEIDAELDKAHAALDRANQQLHESYMGMLEKWSSSIPKDLANLPIPMPGHANAFVMQIGKPVHSFNVDENGKIQVKSRKGDSEVTRNFANEGDLQRKNPELFTKYRETINAQE